MHGMVAEALRSGDRGRNTQAWGTSWHWRSFGYCISPVIRIGLGQKEQRMNMSSYINITIDNKLEVTWTRRPVKKEQVVKNMLAKIRVTPRRSQTEEEETININSTHLLAKDIGW